MRFTHVTPDQYLRQPWKNGGGNTTELIKEMIDGDVLWRLSIASVDRSGPFSDFSGFDRTIMLLKGSGMVLTFDQGAGAGDEVRIDRACEPHRFAGEWRTDCTLIDGPVEDFNFMVNRRFAEGTLQLIDVAGGASPHPLPGDTEVLYGLRGCIEVSSGDPNVVLKAGDTLRIDRAPGESVSASVMFRARELPCLLAAAYIHHHAAR